MAEARTQQQHGFQVRSRTASWALERAYAAAPLILRWTVGPMILAHGLQKLLNLSGAAQGFEQMGVAPGVLFATVVGLIETLGGAGLILGLFTRFWSALLFLVQLVALLVVHLPNGFFLSSAKGPGFEYNLVILGSLGAILVLGAGSISIDHMLRRKDRLETKRTARSATIETPPPTRSQPPPPSTTPPGTRV